MCFQRGTVPKRLFVWIGKGQWKLRGTMSTYSIQRNDGVLKKGLHNHGKVLSAIIAASVHQFFCYSLKEKKRTKLLKNPESIKK